MFSSETYELTVQDYVARRVTYNHLRRVRVIRSNREIASSNGCAEIVRPSGTCTSMTGIIQRIISRNDSCANYFN